MCLYRITERFDPPKRGIVLAWKNFTLTWDYSKLTATVLGLQPSQRPWRAQPYRTGVWLKAKKNKIDAWGHFEGRSERVQYLAGFHGYASRSTAGRSRGNMGVTIPVQFRKIRTVGRQAGVTYVADEMRIPRDWKKYL